MASQDYEEPLGESVAKLETEEEEEGGDEACCLYWMLQADQDHLDAAVISELHEELQVCTRNLGAFVVEAGATAGALARYSSPAGTGASGKDLAAALVPLDKDELNQLGAPFASQLSQSSSPGGEAPKRKPSAADYMVRLGQLLARWAAKQDVPLDLRIGVHCGRLKSMSLPGGSQVGYYGEALGTARRLAEASPRDACVHLSRIAKDSLHCLEYLAFSCTTAQLGTSYCLESWTQVVDEPDSSPVLGLSDSPPRAERHRLDSMLSSAFTGRRSTLPVPPRQGEVLALDESMTLDEFRDLLTEHRVDVWQFGSGLARSLEDFHRRVVTEKKSRLCINSDGALEQQVDIVKINLMAKASSGEDFQLALTSEILPDGRARSRADKFAHRVAVGQTLDEALEECFRWKLGLDTGLQKELLSREPGVSFEQERAPSLTTANLMTSYFKHEVAVRITDCTRPELERLGLPSCQPFTTPANPNFNIPECNWAWHPSREQSSSQAALSQLLQRHGIDVASYSRTALAELCDEVYNAKYSTLAVREDRELERRINVIKVWLCTELLGLEHVLVKRWQFEAGKSDTRGKDRPVTMRMRMDQSWEDAVSLNILDKLGLDVEFQQQHLSVDERSYRLSEEVAYSHRYPGLRTLYLIHEVNVRIPDPLAHGMEVIGLPDGNDFAVTRLRKIDSKDAGSVATGWSWKPLASMGRSLHHALTRRSLLDRQTGDSNGSTQKRRLPVPPPLERMAKDPASEAESANEAVQRESQASSAPQLPLKPARKFSQCLLQDLMVGRKPNLERALNAAQRIRDENYTCRQYFEDCLAAFPEIALYVSGQELGADGAASPATSAGRTAEDEYQRTMGALFAVYWLMRLDSDGAQSFCFGVDEDWYPLSESSQEPVRSAQERKKRQAFLENTPWQELEQLLVDAGLLKGGPSERTHDIDRTLAMLVLTAIHDIMKVQALVPVVAEGHGPWCGYQDGEKVGDHDAALGYALEYMPEAFPSFAMLPRSQRSSVKFTQCKMDYNMGWLVQAEAPPGALFSRFKAVMLSGEARAPDVAFYFVHWLTDLAGAEPCPQEGCEKFVLNFPQRVLASFLSSFSIVQRLSAKTETEVFEEYLLWRWRTTEGRGLGPPPGGPGAIARLRLVIMAQGSTQKVLNALRSLPREDVALLEEELALTGCARQHYECEKCPASSGRSQCVFHDGAGGNPVPSEGPALMVYYAPALMQKAGKVDPAGALLVLADVLRQARSLFPSSPSRADETVIVRIDALKDLEVRAMKEAGSPGEVWILERLSGKDAQVRRVNLADHQKVVVNWSTSRILFADRPRPAFAKTRAWGTTRKSSTWNVDGSSPKSRSRVHSFSPSPRRKPEGAGFWHRALSEQLPQGAPVVVPPGAADGNSTEGQGKRSPKERALFKSN